MLDKCSVFPEKTPFLTEKVEGFLLEKETSFAELLRCPACWLRSMVVILTLALDVVDAACSCSATGCPEPPLGRIATALQLG